MPGAQLPLFRLPHRLALLIAALVALAAWNAFVQDDAFISFTYARNLVEGHGLVWMPGERLEGYTNFLWTLLIAGALRLGVDPVAASIGLGLAAFVGTLVATYRLGCIALRDAAPALTAVALLGLSHTFSAYATGGLETQFQALLFTVSLVVLWGRVMRDAPLPTDCALLSVLLGLTLLTRPDSLLFAALVGLAGLRHLLRMPQAGTRVIPLLIPGVMIVGTYAAWKASFYGSLLPNSFYAKALNAEPGYGLAYVVLFFLVTALVAVVALAALGFARLRAAFTPLLGFLLLLVAVWSFYIVQVGGDFMEFRFFVPVMPALYVVVTWVIFTVLPRPGWRWSAGAVLVVASILQARTFATTVFPQKDWGIESIEQLRRHVAADGDDWAGIGRTLGERLHGVADATIAIGPAGAITYYSRLPSVDIFGVNDRAVARAGLPTRGPPGHQRIASFRYLLERNVAIVIAHPWVLTRSALPQHRYAVRDIVYWMHLVVSRENPLPAGSRMLEIPLGADRFLVTLLLPGHTGVEQRAVDEGWRLVPIEDR